MERLFLFLSVCFFVCGCSLSWDKTVSVHTKEALVSCSEVYTRDIAPLFQRSCIECHKPGGAAAFLRLDSYSEVQKNIERALSRAQLGSMPPMGSGVPLSKIEIEKISRWKSNGMPENEMACASELKGSCKTREKKVLPLRRLTAFQYRNALEDLFGATLLAKLPVVTALTTLPTDDRTKIFSSLDASTSDRHVDAYQSIAYALTAEINVSSATRGALYSCLSATPANLTTCIVPFISQFGQKAFRRPLSASEIDAYKNIYSQGLTLSYGDALESVIAAFLQAPHFIYILELEDENFNLSQKIALGLWGRLPDTTLTQLAQQKKLTTVETLKAEIDINHRANMDVQADLLINAVKCGLTRVGVLQLGPETDYFNANGSVSHDHNMDGSSPERFARAQNVEAYFVQKFIRFLQRLKSTLNPQTGKSLYEESVVVFVNTAGSVIGHDVHWGLAMPAVLAGGAIQTGYLIDYRNLTLARKVDYQGAPIFHSGHKVGRSYNDLLNTIAAGLGVSIPANGFGLQQNYNNYYGTNKRATLPLLFKNL